MYQLSNSSLSIFKECKRCFWLDRNKMTRPRGIFSSFPNAVDKLLKKNLDNYRGKLPEIMDKNERLKGFQLYTGKELSKMRNWKTNPLKMIDDQGNTIVGAFDDLLFNPETKQYAILDYKTKGSIPDQDYCEKYYQTQMDLYTRFLTSNNMNVADFSVLLYFFPVESETTLIELKQELFFITPNIENAGRLFVEAIECLEGNLPESSENCEFCEYVKTLSKLNIKMPMSKGE